MPYKIIIERLRKVSEDDPNHIVIERLTEIVGSREVLSSQLPKLFGATDDKFFSLQIYKEDR